MKYKDYYASLGLARGASDAEIKKAYRKLAHKYHPDVSKEAGAEARFKEVAEAYQTLKDPEKRAAYDRLGSHAPGEEFRPPPDWGRQYAGGGESFEGVDLADLFAELAARQSGAAGRRANAPIRGEDYEFRTGISIEQAFAGTVLELNLGMPDYDASGRLQRVTRTIKVRVPKGAADGQRLRLAGMGGRGASGGAAGDLYVTIELLPHRLYRADGHDLYLDLPLAPWEAALGASVEVPTPGGIVHLKVPANTASGQNLRLGGRGLPRAHAAPGDLYAAVRIVNPPDPSARARELFQELATAGKFEPRAELMREARRGS